MVPVQPIPFSQDSFSKSLEPSRHKTLCGFDSRRGGICALICNRILIDDALGKGQNEDAIKASVTVDRINENKIKKSHLLDVYSIFHKMLAFLFAIYPDNIFPYQAQCKLVNKTANKERRVNRQILSSGLKNIPEGTKLKLEVFTKAGLHFSGHSLLIKKMPNDMYIFFDPNEGEWRNLSLDELADKIDGQLDDWEGTDILLMKGEDFLKRLDKKMGLSPGSP